ncbi:peptidase S9 [Akanthomyces lecanii RCEF 1005]|uniref:Probable dipeptidyl-aminopeptidase B n=1 Tax=Akanthomyces lecanii RCEF 1005 TaxID=1081108 RepID=A0A162MUW6_CORDF|nr:peptidase S9 [Akanthomyces lecanii RCEF 1005]
MGVVNIEDTPDGLVLRWEQDALADIDFENSKTQATKPEHQAFIRKHTIWRCEIPVDDVLFLKPYNMRYIGWSERGQRYRFIFNEFNERGHGHVRLLEIGLDGVVNLLVEEKSATVVDYDQKLWCKISPEDNNILWTRERDGRNHLYRFSADGTLKNQITQGDWLVRSVEFVDTRERKTWFKAFGVKGQDPYHTHLACVNFGGAALRFITEEDSSHLLRFGPDRRFIIDSWSRVDLLPRAGVIDAATGKQVVFLHKAGLGPLESTYIFPERFVAQGRDHETDIYGIIIKPPNFDKDMTYPVIDIIYAHPSQFIVPKNFKNLGALRAMSEAGYVIVMVDGMGTNWRFKVFHDVAYKNMKDAGIPDHIA